MIGDNFSSVLEAARTGAEWAWTALYRDLAPAVLGYLRARGATDAEDITQEVFVAAVRGLRDFDGGEDKFRSWVFVIAHRRLLDERRHASRHPVDPTPFEKLDRNTGNVEHEAMANLARQNLVLLIHTLAPNHQEVLLLRLVAGLTAEEIAQIVGKSAGAVKQLQRRALNALAVQLGKQELGHRVPK